MKLVLLSIAPNKEPWLQEAITLYQKKLKPFGNFEIIHIKSKSSSRSGSADKKKAESDSILAQVTKDDFLLLCDEKGKELDSVNFSKKFFSAYHSGKKRLVVAIGGAYGFTDSIKLRADFIWSLSPLTFNHLIAHIVVLEQLYRAFAIEKKLPYHNE